MQTMMSVSRPLVIMSYPRSGSSMVASLFAAHGVWCGTCRQPDAHNPRGYFEHVGIGKLIGYHVGHSVHKGICPNPPEGWQAMVERCIRADGYQSGPWLYKASAVYWKLLEPFDPHWVIAWRPFDAVRRSGLRSGAYRITERNRRAHADALAAIWERAVVVESDDVVAGDFSRIGQALKLVGLDLDEAVARSVVDPSLWHYRGKVEA